MTDAQLAELVRRYQHHLITTSSTAAAHATGMWDDLGSWDEADMARFTAAATAATNPARSTGAALAGGFLSAVAAITATALNPPPTPDWAPAFYGHWNALSNGRPWEEAIAVGRSLVEAIAFDSVQSAARDATNQIDRQEPKLTGWQRIPNANACEWCTTAAGQTYHTADSADFGHDRCACTVAPA